jgi:hypothetical protein
MVVLTKAIMVVLTKAIMVVLIKAIMVALIKAIMVALIKATIMAIVYTQHTTYNASLALSTSMLSLVLDDVQEGASTEVFPPVACAPRPGSPTSDLVCGLLNSVASDCIGEVNDCGVLCSVSCTD